jgi:hypothetical protein
MNIAFTICSNNYLAQAKTLGDSLLKENSDYKFVIVLVDKPSPQLDYSTDIAHNIIQIEDIMLEGFDDLWMKYNIIELNTCVKPSVFRYFFKEYPKAEFLFYFDPDIFIYDNLLGIESKFKEYDFILTPHIYNRLSLSDIRPNEFDFLNYGIFNIGFLGLRNSFQIMNEFLPWWEERTLNLGFIRPCDGLFVDQLWFNIVPLFFNRICILDHQGCNVAPWNLHERELKEIEGRIIVNNRDPLIFFHFSTFKYTDPKTLFYNYDRNLSHINDTIKKLYKSYCGLLIENKIEKMVEIKCYYTEQKTIQESKFYTNQLVAEKDKKPLFKRLFPRFVSKIIRRVRG